MHSVSQRSLAQRAYGISGVLPFALPSSPPSRNQLQECLAVSIRCAVASRRCLECLVVSIRCAGVSRMCLECLEFLAASNRCIVSAHPSSPRRTRCRTGLGLREPTRFTSSTIPHSDRSSPLLPFPSSHRSTIWLRWRAGRSKRSKKSRMSFRRARASQ